MTAPRFLADIATTIRKLAEIPEDGHPHAGRALDQAGNGDGEADPTTTPAPAVGDDAPVDANEESPDVAADATIEETPDGRLADSPPESEA